MVRLGISAELANVTILYGQGETKFFDAIRLISSEFNPFGYAQGAIGAATGVGFYQHKSY